MPRTRPLRLKGTNDSEFTKLPEAPETIFRALGGDDTIVGTTNTDRVFGGRGDDLFVDPGGDGFFDGGRGFDTLQLSGSIFDYTWEPGKGKSWIITNQKTGESITIRKVERVAFDDYAFLPDIDDEVVVQADAGRTDEDTLQFGLDAFDFDGDTIAFVAAQVSDGAHEVDLSLLDMTEGMETYSGSSAHFLLGVAPADPVDMTWWQALAEGETANVTLSISLEVTNADGQSHLEEKNLDFVIEGVNDAPVAHDVVIDAEAMGQVLNDNGQGTLEQVLSFEDVDLSDTHSFALEQTGEDEIEFTFDPETGALTIENAAGAAQATFDWTVTDNHGASDTATLTLHFPAPPVETVVIDFEEFSFEGTGHAAYAQGGVLSKGIQFSTFGTVVETDETEGVPGYDGFDAGLSPDDPDGMNVMFNAFRTTVYFYDPEGDEFDLESAYMTFIWNSFDNQLTGGDVTFIGYRDGPPGGTTGEVGRQTFTLDGTTQLLEFDDAIFDNVDQVRIVPDSGLLWAMDDITLVMPT